MAQQAARAGVKRLVYVSSVKVNGEDPHQGGGIFSPKIKNIWMDHT
jgi:nucleoside-diphosphate-sugar epimerase